MEDKKKQMKVTRELKELLRRKLQKVYNRKKEKELNLLKKKYSSVEKEMKKLYRAKVKAGEKFNEKENEINNLKGGYYIDYKGNLNVSEPKINFDIEENLYCFIEKMELSNDKEGLLKGILEEIKKL